MHVQARLMYALDALYDLVRYTRHSNSLLRRAKDRYRQEALLFYYYHKIEKALAMSSVKQIFGLGYIGKYLALMEQWFDEVKDLDSLAFQGGYLALEAYRRHVGVALKEVDLTLWNRINGFLSKCPTPAEDGVKAGAIPISADRLKPKNAWKHFSALALSRSSVRNFLDKPVPTEEVTAAVHLAQRTPSVCNRQCWRVHVFSTPEDKALVLKYQNGNAGFGHMAAHVLLVTADLRTFVSSGERNQAFIDGGLYAMSLLYALQARGIASCPLNLGLSFFMDRALRKAAKLPANENLIMMIAIGYPPDELAITASARVPTDTMLRFRDFKTEQVAGVNLANIIIS